MMSCGWERERAVTVHDVGDRLEAEKGDAVQVAGPGDGGGLHLLHGRLALLHPVPVLLRVVQGAAGRDQPRLRARSTRRRGLTVQHRK